MTEREPTTQHDQGPPRKVLIIGTGGSGKTHLAEAWRAMGVNAFDADAVPGLIRFVDHTGARVRFALDADADWWSRHHFLWDPAALEQLLTEHTSLYLLGIADNMEEFFPRFDTVYYLRAEPELIAERLTSPLRDNPMGKTEEQRRLMIAGARRFDPLAAAYGLPVLDASLPPEDLLAQVTHGSTRRRRRRRP